MYNLQSVNDKFIIFFLTVWLLFYGILKFSPIMLGLIFIFISSVLFALGIIWIRKPALVEELPQFITHLDNYSKIHFKVIGKSDYSERGNIISRVIGIPRNYKQYKTVNKNFHYSRLVHEIGHAVNHDCLTMCLYIILAFIAFASSLDAVANQGQNLEFFDSDHFYWLKATYPENVEEYVRKSLIRPLIFSVIILTTPVSAGALIYFLKEREYRADAYAYSKLGEQYIGFLKHQLLKESLSTNNKLWRSLWNKITHPSFKTRVIKLRAKQNSFAFIIISGTLWGSFIFFMSPFLLMAHQYITADSAYLLKLLIANAFNGGDEFGISTFYYLPENSIFYFLFIFFGCIPLFIISFIRVLILQKYGVIKIFSFLISISAPFYVFYVLGEHLPLYLIS